MDEPEYVDQDGNVVPLCVICHHWRATDGNLCDLCAQEIQDNHKY